MAGIVQIFSECAFPFDTRQMTSVHGDITANDQTVKTHAEETGLYVAHLLTNTIHKRKETKDIYSTYFLAKLIFYFIKCK